MKVLVLANEQQQEEWFSLPHDAKLTPTILNSLSDILSESNYDACIDLLFDQSPQRAARLRAISPLNIINSVEHCLNPNHHDFIRINGWNSFLKRTVVEASMSQTTLKTSAERLFQLFGRKTKWVGDITGFITPRVVASIINEAFFSLEEEVSTVEQIDLAMKAGTNYPYGPFEWSKIIGTDRVHSLLSALSREHQRYQPSTLLTKAVLA